MKNKTLKTYLIFIAVSAAVMAVMPLCAYFANEAGFAVCLIMFYAVVPVYSAFVGAYAGKNIRALFALPLIPAATFCAVTLIFFSPDPTFVLYSAAYLVISGAAAAISAPVHKRRVSELNK